MKRHIHGGTHMDEYTHGGDIQTERTYTWRGHRYGADTYKRNILKKSINGCVRAIVSNKSSQN